MTTAKSSPVTVYVDVVCDLFHAGHVAFFEKARALGDRLIVGVLSDENVATYKPPPIMTLHERCAVVRSCRLVDDVVADAPLFCTSAFLDSIAADIVCHGDDLTEAERHHWYADVIATDRLRLVSYTRHISSRDIVKRVLERRSSRGGSGGPIRS